MKTASPITQAFQFAPKIFCLVGPSGVGKTTLLRKAVESFRNCKDFYPLTEIVSTTTRQPRPGEKEGVDYQFLDHEQAQHNIDTGAYIEHVVYHGNTYGFLAADFEAGLNQEINLICVVERHGLEILQEKFGPKIVPILVVPPDRETLVKRLQQSGRKKTEIETRLQTIDEEMDELGFDIVLTNDKLEKAVGSLVREIRYRSITPG